MDINEVKARILEGGAITRQEAYELYRWGDLDELCDAAETICRHFEGDRVDSCSIVNARSGRCPENCQWCAQSAHHKSVCEVYDILPYADTLALARHNEAAGIRRFSLVTSGRGMRPADLERFCGQIRSLGSDTGLFLCASMGLLGEEDMVALRNAGVQRYHCNMETCAEQFRKLCTTHTREDKLATIAAARKAGLSVCSGGIIGMGETADQRVDFAFELAEIGPDSVPINILNPIPGTPLEATEPISEEDIIRTVAIFRFVLPRAVLRFAGGRKRMSRESMLRIMKGGLHGVLMGDMLTTSSHAIEADRELFRDAGLSFQG